MSPAIHAAAVNSRAEQPDDIMEMFEIIDSRKLANRWCVPESWIRDRTRSRTSDTIPHVRLGRYVRFEWVSPELNAHPACGEHKAKVLNCPSVDEGRKRVLLIACFDSCSPEAGDVGREAFASAQSVGNPGQGERDSGMIPNGIPG
jgi:hypothetical protein